MAENPARSSFPVCRTSEITTEPSVFIIDEIAAQLAIDCSWMPPELSDDPSNKQAPIAHAHDRVTLFETEMPVVLSLCASF